MRLLAAEARQGRWTRGSPCVAHALELRFVRHSCTICVRSLGRSPTAGEMVAMESTFWGKARGGAGEGASHHALAFHALDVAAVAEVLLDLFPAVVTRFAAVSGADAAEVRRLLVRLAALHDLGKYAAGFQAKVPALYPAVLGALPDPVPLGDHPAIGLRLMTDELRAAMEKLIADFSPFEWKPLLMAVAAHHGRPVLDEEPSRRLPARAIGLPSIAAARSWIDLVIEIVPGPPFSGTMDETRAGSLSMMLAGFVNLADWIGSNQEVFTYCAEGDPFAYWREAARPRAREAVARAGLTTCAISPDEGLRALTGRESPSPLQRWAETVALPASGPTLVLIEDMTGAGKTEAAVILAHRLMRAGRGDGIFVALPTQATANAMYRRLRGIHRRLFAGGARPSLALAHGAARLDDQFTSSIVAVGRDEPAYGDERGDGEETASAACAAWIADDRRKAFFADVGAGTIDQAFLAVLPAKFAALRLLGLSRRVLVVDEAHGYAAYEGEELARLIGFHAQQGGATIVLSATLPEVVKVRLVGAFRHGAGIARAPRVAWSPAYPAATIVDGGGAVAMQALATRSDRAACVEVARLCDAEAAMAEIVAAARAGAAVAWIRNSVDDCLEAHAALRAAGLAPVLFHARFAMVDRQAIEARVMDLFGPHSTPDGRRGRVIVASQVIEQSLDLDFDLLVSDLAPIDLLLQRAGRLWRHAGRERPVATARLLVVSPDPAVAADRDWVQRAFPRGAFVYRNHALLWRTAEVLFAATRVNAPGDIRPLVEAVYGRGALDAAPAGLDGRRAAAEGRDLADASMAEQNLLRLETGYDSGSPWSGDIVTPTRLGDQRTVFRLARWDGAQLKPWAPIEGEGGPLDLARAWALSEVAVRATRASGRGAYDRVIEARAGAIEVPWREHGDGCVVLPMVVDPHISTFCGKIENKRGVEVSAFYSAERGLILS